MIIAEKGIIPDIKLWRGDISAYRLDLRLIHTNSEVVTLIEGLRDLTPSRPTIKLIPPADVWKSLPGGEYEYYVEYKGSILAAGLLKNIKANENYSYDTEHYYTEYRA